MNIHVDTLEYANVLVKSGMERAQAEAVAKLQAQTVKDLIDHELVTKDDLEGALDKQEVRLQGEIRASEARLREDIRSETAKLREEARSEATKLREETRSDASMFREETRSDAAMLREENRSEAAKLREDMRDMRSDLERKMDTLMIQIRALQLGGAIAAFAIGSIVLLTRLIK